MAAGDMDCDQEEKPKSFYAVPFWEEWHEAATAEPWYDDPAAVALVAVAMRTHDHTFDLCYISFC